MPRARGSFSNDSDDRDGKDNSKRFIKQNNTWITLFCPFLCRTLLHDYDVIMPNFTFYGGCKQAATKFSSSF